MTTLPIELPIVPSSDASAHMAFEEGDTRIERTILPCGTRVLTQHVPATRSVGVSLWVSAGSRDEIPAHAGSTHFLEHLLFKGTSRRSALDIAVAFDEVGGESNAETGKEHTNYWARVLSDDLPMATDVLTDMVTGSLLDPVEFETERGVILDELAMSEDSPVENVHEAFQLAVYGDTPLGRPVGGTSDTIRAVGRDDVWEHYREAYAPDALIVAAAGHVNHDAFVEMVAERLERSRWGEDGLTAAPPRPRRSAHPLSRPEDALDAIVRERDVEQAHIIVGMPSMKNGDERRPIMSVLLSILGGSMSSRLFQEIREKRGLAYSTYAFDSAYSDAGAFGMYAGTSPARVDEVEALMLEQLHLLAEHGPTQADLERVRGQVRGGMALGLEDNWSRMVRLGRSELSGRYLTVDTALARINAVTAQHVQELAAELASAPMRRARVMPKSSHS